MIIRLCTDIGPFAIEADCTGAFLTKWIKEMPMRHGSIIMPTPLNDVFRKINTLARIIS